MTTQTLIEIYVAIVLAVMLGLWVFSEMRRHRFGPTHTGDRIFRCKNCGNVYTDDPDVDRSRCTQCGKMNEAIEF